MMEKANSNCLPRAHGVWKMYTSLAWTRWLKIVDYENGFLGVPLLPFEGTCLVLMHQLTWIVWLLIHV